jgi:hypothetical protein
MNPVLVSTFHMSGSFEQETVIDMGRETQRKWLSRHMGWALRNGRYLELTPTTRPVIFKEKANASA